MLEKLIKKTEQKLLKALEEDSAGVAEVLTHILLNLVSLTTKK